MTIEEKCNEIIPSTYKKIYDWTWDEVPMSHHPYNLRFPSFQTSHFGKVDILIDRADPSECLTSKSEYIRECKKWYMEEKW